MVLQAKYSATGVLPTKVAAETIVVADQKARFVHFLLAEQGHVKIMRTQARWVVTQSLEVVTEGVTVVKLWEKMGVTRQGEIINPVDSIPCNEAKERYTLLTD